MSDLRCIRCHTDFPDDRAMTRHLVDDELIGPSDALGMVRKAREVAGDHPPKATGPQAKPTAPNQPVPRGTAVQSESADDWLIKIKPDAFVGPNRWRDAIDVFRRELFLWALRRQGGNLFATERYLGLSLGWGTDIVAKFGLREELKAIRKVTTGA